MISEVIFAALFLTRQLETRSMTKTPSGIPLVVSGEKQPVTGCAESVIVRFYRIIVGNFPAENAGGERGEGLENPNMEASGQLNVTATGGREVSRGNFSFMKGEPIEVTGISQFGSSPRFLRVWFSSLLRRNITRGRAAMEHQTPERLSSAIQLPASIDCAAFESIFATYFAPVDAAYLASWLAKYPTGVVVAEIKEGMTFADVEAILGVPERKAKVSGKTIYFYPKMKVVFRSGKVTDIE